RFYPVFLDRPGVLLAASVRGFLSASLVALAAFAVALPIGRARGVSVVFLVCVLLATAVIGMHSFVLQVANSQGRPLRFAMLTWIRSLITLVVGAAFVSLGTSYVGALVGMIAGTLLAAIFANPLKGLRPVDSPESRQLSLKLFRYGTPLIVTLL